MLLSITAGLVNNENLSKKFKAMALIDYMRSKGKVPEAGTLKQREPGSHAPDKGPQEEAPPEGEEAVEQKMRTNEVTSMAAFKNIRLTQEEENEAYLELSEFLLDKSLCVLSGQTLEFVTDKDSVRVLFCQTKSKMLCLRYEEAAEDLHHLFTNVD